MHVTYVFVFDRNLKILMLLEFGKGSFGHNR